MAQEARTRLSLPGAVALLAIVSVLVFVSLPRLHRIAKHENEVDAHSTVKLLVRELDTWRSEHSPASLPPIAELTESDELERALSDAELSTDGRFLRRHGYVFCVVELPRPPLFESAGLEPPVFAAEQSPPPWGPRLGIQAWPWKHGKSGSVALLGTEDGRIYRHANVPVRWDGDDSTARGDWSWRGWEEIQ